MSNQRLKPTRSLSIREASRQPRCARRCSRRRFIAASIAGTGLAAGLRQRLRADNPPSERLNLGVIGVGNRGVSNIAELRSENIIALCDVDRGFLDAMASRHPAAKTYADFREMIEHPDLDAVLISSPDHTHYHAAMLAMQRKLHVYCEKPLAHSLWETRHMAAAAKHFGVVTQTGNQHHASDGYRRVAEIIQSGVLGGVSEVHAWTNRPIWPQGRTRPTEQPPVPASLNWDLWLGPAPRRPYHPIYHPRGWRGWFDFGGGALGDMGPHLLDPVLWAFDLKSPTSIAAESSEMNDETFPLWSIVRFEFAAADDRPPLRLTWYDGDKQPPAEVTGVKRLPANGVLFIAERAKLFVPDYGRQPIVIPIRKGAEIELPTPFLPHSPGQHSEWLAACKGHGRTSCDFVYGQRLTDLCLLGNLALCSGQAIRIEGTCIRAASGRDVSPFIKRPFRAGWPELAVAGI